MSGKKPSSSTISWSNCTLCKISCHNRTLLQKHIDLGCGDVRPFITPERTAIFDLALSDSQQSKLYQDIPVRKHSELLFLHSAFLIEMGLKTLDWVRVTKVTGKNHGTPDTSVPIFMRVWAVDTGPPFKAQVLVKATTTYPLVLGGPGSDIVSVEGNQENVPYASEITLVINQLPKGLTLEDIHIKVKIWLIGKISTVRTVFCIQVLTHFVTILVDKITSVETSINGDSSGFQVTKETEVILSCEGVTQDPHGVKDDQVTLESIGGLSEEIAEVVDTVKYSLTSKRPRVPRGILLYGEHGTGKTLLIKALCHSLDIRPIWFHNQSSNRLRDLFKEAIGTGKKCGILIENLDSLSSSSSKRDSDLAFGFAEELVHEMDILPVDSLVIVLATAKSPDQLDPILRSAKVLAKEVELPVPSVLGRREILDKILSPLEHSLDSDDITKLAEDTHGFVGADLEGLRATACRHAGNEVLSTTHFVMALKTARPSAMKSVQLEIPNVRWTDIGGMDELKFQLKQSVEWPLKHPEAFGRLGLTPPKGILLYGPPGCSKTMIAKALATETRLNFISVKGSDLLSKWVGESEKAVQTLFRKARKVAPAILFFDELDALGGERGGQGSGSNVHERVLAQLLVEIDGIEPLNDVTILAATNRPDLIDKALTRPGRLDRIIYVPLPDALTRREILRIHLGKMPVGGDVSLDFLVDSTQGYSGAEIGGICQEAGLKALERDLNATVVTLEHFHLALAKSPPRLSPELMSFYESYGKLR